MPSDIDRKSFKIIQDVDQAISVMRNAATRLQESGKHPNKWWQPKNMNRDFLLKHAEPYEFYVGLVARKPAVAAILQDNERNQSWKYIDGDRPKSALYIHWLSVNRQFAGKNLSKFMVNFAEQQAESRNIKLLRLDTNADEVKLCQIYENLGFTLMGIEQEDYQKTAYYQKVID